jgi:hypothetical protein
MSIYIAVLLLSFFAAYSAGYSSAAVESHNEILRFHDEGSKPLDCADPKGYSVVEVRDAEASRVDVVQGDKVFKTIRLPTGIERNGFGFNWAKKTKEGFEISVEYGSRYYYGKRFNFICKRHEFYLSKIIVDSFDKAHPEKWNTKVIRVKPNVPLERFVITDFMLEGGVK